MEKEYYEVTTLLSCVLFCSILLKYWFKLDKYSILQLETSLQRQALKESDFFGLAAYMCNIVNLRHKPS